MIPMFRLLALLPPPIRRLLTVQVLYDPYVQAPGSPSTSNRMAWNIVVNIDTKTISTRPTRGRYDIF
jgi:hypothetical protein